MYSREASTPRVRRNCGQFLAKLPVTRLTDLQGSPVADSVVLGHMFAVTSYVVAESQCAEEGYFFQDGRPLQVAN